MKKYFLLVSICIFVLVGCAAKSGVVKIGENQYLVSSLGGLEASGSIVKIGLLKQAEEFCASMALKLVVVSSTHTNSSIVSFPGAEVLFSCNK